jgi:hypothetical protein
MSVGFIMPECLVIEFNMDIWLIVVLICTWFIWLPIVLFISMYLILIIVAVILFIIDFIFDLPTRV